jgi:hypothetical protein
LLGTLDTWGRVYLYHASLRDTGASAPMPLCEIQRRDRLNQPASWKQETGAKVCLSRDRSLNGSLLIDIVRERKRNADGVCPCGFHVSGNEETNV